MLFIETQSGDTAINMWLTNATHLFVRFIGISTQQAIDHTRLEINITQALSCTPVAGGIVGANLGRIKPMILVAT